MASSRWVVSVNGQQLEGDYSVEEVKTQLRIHQGKQVLVWTQGMSQWAEPTDLPQFRATAPSPEAPAPSNLPSFGMDLSRREIKMKAGLFKGLLDFGFTHLIAVKIVPILYTVVALLLGLALVAGILFSFYTIFTGLRYDSFSAAFMGLVWLLLTPVLALIYLCFYRLTLETIIVLFRIKEDLGTLVERSAEKDKK